MCNKDFSIRSVTSSINNFFVEPYKLNNWVLVCVFVLFLLHNLVNLLAGVPICHGLFASILRSSWFHQKGPKKKKKTKNGNESITIQTWPFRWTLLGCFPHSTNRYKLVFHQSSTIHLRNKVHMKVLAKAWLCKGFIWVLFFVYKK